MSWKTNLASLIEVLVDDTFSWNTSATLVNPVNCLLVPGQLTYFAAKRRKKSLEKDELVRVISRNSMSAWKSRFKLDGHLSVAIGAATKILTYIQKKDNRNQQLARICGGGGGGGSERERKIRRIVTTMEMMIKEKEKRSSGTPAKPPRTQSRLSLIQGASK